MPTMRLHGTNRRQPVGDDDDGSAAHDRAHVVLNDPLAVVVERRGRLVEDEDARIGGERAGDGDPLALAAGEVGAALLDHRVVALRKLGDELVRAGEPRRLHHHHPRHRRIAERDVLVDRPVEQDVLLQHDADLPSEPARIELGDVDAVDHHLTHLRAVQALDELGQRRFSRARRPDDRRSLRPRRSKASRSCSASAASGR